MDWRVLLSCVSLWAGLALAEVGTFDLCRSSFYRQTEPLGFDRTSDDSAQICQKYRGTHFFATLYDKSNRIPLWSAYKLDHGRTKGPPRPNDWFVEPQLWDPNQSREMTSEDGSTLNELRSSQAINEDYQYSSYDRGHLNPFSFQSGVGRIATMTLTNAVPMDPCFNRIRWYKLEKNLKEQLTMNCIGKKGTPYLVTGAVPSGSEKIPIQDEEEEEEEEEEEGEDPQKYNRVSVPSHIWTAVCCNHVDDERKFSFAFLAENKEESRLQMLQVDELISKLSGLYPNSPSINIFKDDCNSKSKRGQEILSKIRSVLYHSFQVLLSDQYSQLLPPGKRSRLDKETSQLMQSKNLDQNKMQLTNIGLVMTFPSLADWSSYFEKTYDQDNLACVLEPSAGANPGGVAKGSGNRDRFCIPQQPRSDVSATGWSCVGQVCGHHEGTPYSWCYTSDTKWGYCCLDKCTVNKQSNQYECSQLSGYPMKCSPLYSMVTISGEACRVDHPCGLYGESYFWCYMDYGKGWDYCCSPRHYCGEHGYDYQWCYTADPQRSWQKCTLHAPTQKGGAQCLPPKFQDISDLRY
uniref:Endonuclease domain-containing 1 protein-like n=1 Tax=Pelusios castaneus TaxID=367368 RepID=A0A8C8VJT0_9SAUR